jgi:hypothetical protein
MQSRVLLCRAGVTELSWKEFRASKMGQGSNQSTEASQVIVDAWKEIIRGEGQTVGSGERKSATISSGRVDAAASGAVAGGLRQITPW